MNPGETTPAGPVAPAIMRIGAARMTAGLDRYPRLDLEAHRDLFGRLPRLSEAELITIGQRVDLRGHGGAAFPFARKLKAVVDAAHKSDQPTIVVVNATEGEPGSFKDKMLLMRSPYLVLSGAALAAEAIGAEEIVVGVASHDLANRSLEVAIAAEPGLRDLVASWRYPSGSSPARAARSSVPSTARRPSRPAARRSPQKAACMACQPCCPTPRPTRSWLCSRCSGRSAMRRSARPRNQVPSCSA